MALNLRGWICLAALGLATGCVAPEDDDTRSVDTRSTSTVGVLRGALSALLSRGEGTPPRITLTDAQLRGLGSPVLIVEDPQRGSEAGFLPEARNEGAVQWRSPEEIGITTLNGQIIGTAGYGDDLSSVDAPQLALSGRAVRDHYYLGDTETIQRRRFFCSFSDGGTAAVEIAGVAVPTRVIRERCESEDGVTAQNRYNVDATGAVVASRQFVTPGIGYLDLADTGAVLR